MCGGDVHTILLLPVVAGAKRQYKCAYVACMFLCLL